MRDYLPEIGWPVYDLRRRKFGICVDRYHFAEKNREVVKVHVEGDRFPVHVIAEQKEYEYPKFYMNDAVTWGAPLTVYYIKHVHYHVPRDIWQYTVAEQGIDGFDRYTVDGDESLTLVKRFTPKV